MNKVIQQDALTSSPLARRVTLSIFQILAVFVGATLFMLPAVLNGFPFVAPDTSRYLTHTLRLWSSPFYGWFIYLFHLNTFIWSIIIAQCLIVSHLVLVITRLHIPKKYYLLIFVGISFCLTAVSSLPYFSGLIMPDILTAVMILVLYVIAFEFSKLHKTEKVYFLFLAFGCIISHFSNFPLAVIIIPVAAVLLLMLRQSWSIALRQTTLLLLPLALAAGTFFLTNLIAYGIPALFPAGPNFLLGNMIEYGPARQYLEAACPAAGYKVCPYVSELPATSNQFLWTPDFLLGRLDFVQVGEEASRIIVNTVKTRPREVAYMFVQTSMLAIRSYAPATDLTLFPRFEPELLTALDRFGPETPVNWKASAERKDDIPRVFLSRIQKIFALPVVMGLLVGCILALSRGNKGFLALPAFVTCAYIINAVICGFTSGVFDRYQARLSWLLILSLIILWAELFVPQSRAAGSPIFRRVDSGSTVKP